MIAERIFFVIIIVVCLTGLEAQVLSPEDEYFYGYEADRYDWSKHPCRRTCNSNEPPRKCYYAFVVEIFMTMSKACYNCPFNVTDCYRPHCIPADGAQKSVYVVNRQLPGPTIEVCENDEIIVDVRNAMLTESTSIHWHGIDQTGTPYMDGVVYLTQCPIPPGDSFRYVFKAEQSGTYFWHSHMGSQRDDGLTGPLIVHSPPTEDAHWERYNYDYHVMLINDWLDSESNTAHVKQNQGSKSGTRANTILVNGLGRFNKVEGDNGTSQYTPTTIFQVKKNFRYRFRLINAGATDCPIQMSIDSHTMLIISMDANDIEPVEVDSLYIWIGERVDFVVTANQEIGNYWIRYRGLGQCNDKESDIRVHQVAILRYESATETDPTSPVGYDIHVTPDVGRIFNPYNNGTEDPKGISIPLLKALAKDDEANTRKPDYQFYIVYDFYKLDNYNFHRKNLYGFHEVDDKFKEHTLQLNHISLKMPSFPLLSQGDLIMGDTLCNSTTMADKNCTVNQCACTHVLQVKLNSVVELVIIDKGINLRDTGTYVHPLHLHGHFFRVIAMERMNEQVSVNLVKKLDREGKIKRYLDYAPLKDTVKILNNGYTIIRFHANNSGYWLYHCHIDHHMINGMALIFKVGEQEDFPSVPIGFPKCGNY